jgi:hypothetical protein
MYMYVYIYISICHHHHHHPHPHPCHHYIYILYLSSWLWSFYVSAVCAWNGTVLSTSWIFSLSLVSGVCSMCWCESPKNRVLYHQYPVGFENLWNISEIGPYLGPNLSPLKLPFESFEDGEVIEIRDGKVMGICQMSRWPRCCGHHLSALANVPKAPQMADGRSRAQLHTTNIYKHL